MEIKTYHNIINHLRYIIAGTEWEGHVYAVGGCVRDLMRQQPIKDIDLVVDLPDGGIGFAKWLYENGVLIRVPVVYERYGTAMFHLKEFPDAEIEVVHTRKEQYKDPNSRNPEQMYGSLEEDIMRRDFTCNTLLYNISNDKILDITGKGMEDIKNKIIRSPLE